MKKARLRGLFSFAAIAAPVNARQAFSARQTFNARQE
jgi:hypothetical protein